MKEYPLPANAMPAHRRARCQGQRLVHRQQERHRSAISIPRPARSPSTRCPIPNAKDPHTLVFDKQGHRAGSRCRTATWSAGSIRTSGDIKLVTLKTPNAKPYGIKIDAEGNPWFSCNGQPLPLQDRPGEHGADRGQAAARRHHGAAPRHRRGRHDLVRQFGPGPARPLRSEDRRDQGMAVAERAEVASLRHRRGRRHRLVQRVRHAARSAGPLRSQDRDVPELGDPVGQHLCRHHPAHAARRATAAC